MSANETNSRANYLKAMYAGLNSKVNGSSINAVGDNSMDAVAVNANLENAIAQGQSMKKQESESSKDDLNFFQRAFQTMQSSAYEIGKGFFGFFDSIGDFSNDLFADWGWISDDERDRRNDNDWVSTASKWWVDLSNPIGLIQLGVDAANGELGQEAQNQKLAQTQANSFANDWGETGQFIRGVENSIGHMIPSMIAGQVGLPFGEVATKALSLGTMGLSAFSSKADEIYRKTGDMGKAMASGGLDASIEIGTELMGDLTGVSKVMGVFGDGADKIASKLGMNAIGKFVTEAFGEGMEEVVSGVLAPFVDAISEGNSAFEQWNDPNFWFDVGKQGLAGAATGGIMAGINIANARQTYGKGGNAVISDFEALEQARSEWEKSKDGSDRQLRLAKKVAEKLSKYSNSLQKWGKTASQENVKNMAGLFQQSYDGGKANAQNVFDKAMQDFESETKTNGEFDITKARANTLIKDLSTKTNLSLKDAKIEIGDTKGKNATLTYDANGNAVITLSSKLSGGEAVGALVHEYLGHVIAEDIMSPEEKSSMVSHMRDTKWYKRNGENYERAYTSEFEKSKEFSKDRFQNSAERSKAIKSAVRSELINKYLEEMVTASDKDGGASFRTAEDLFISNSLMDKVRKLFRTSKSVKEMMKDNNVGREIVKTVNAIVDGSRYKPVIKSIIRKNAKGVSLTEEETRVAKAYKDTIGMYDAMEKAGLIYFDKNGEVRFETSERHSISEAEASVPKFMSEAMSELGEAVEFTNGDAGTKVKIDATNKSDIAEKFLESSEKEDGSILTLYVIKNYLEKYGLDKKSEFHVRKTGYGFDTVIESKLTKKKVRFEVYVNEKPTVEPVAENEGSKIAKNPSKADKLTISDWSDRYAEWENEELNRDPKSPKNKLYSKFIQSLSASDYKSLMSTVSENKHGVVMFSEDGKSKFVVTPNTLKGKTVEVKKSSNFVEANIKDIRTAYIKSNILSDYKSPVFRINGVEYRFGKNFSDKYFKTNKKSDSNAAAPADNSAKAVTATQEATKPVEQKPNVAEKAIEVTKEAIKPADDGKAILNAEKDILNNALADERKANETLKKKIEQNDARAREAIENREEKIKKAKADAKEAIKGKESEIAELKADANSRSPMQYAADNSDDLHIELAERTVGAKVADQATINAAVDDFVAEIHKYTKATKKPRGNAKLKEAWNKLPEGEYRLNLLKKYVEKAFKYTPKGTDSYYKAISEALNGDQTNIDLYIENEARNLYDVIDSTSRSSQADQLINYMKVMNNAITTKNIDLVKTSKMNFALYKVMRRAFSKSTQKNGTGQMKTDTAVWNDVKSIVSTMLRASQKGKITVKDFTNMVTKLGIVGADGNVSSANSITSFAQEIGNIDYGSLDIDQALVSDIQGKIDKARENILSSLSNIAEIYESKLNPKAELTNEQKQAIIDLTNAMAAGASTFSKADLDITKARVAKLKEAVAVGRDFKTKYHIGDRVMKAILDYSSPNVAFAIAFGGTESQAYKETWGVIEKSYVDYIKTTNEYKSKVREIMREHKDISRNLGKKIEVKDADGVTRKIQRQALYSFYLNDMVEDNRTRLIRAKDNINYHAKDRLDWKFKYDTMKEATNSLTDAEKAGLQAIHDIYNKGVNGFSVQNLYTDAMKENGLIGTVLADYYPVLASETGKAHADDVFKKAIGQQDYKTNNRMKQRTNKLTQIEINVSPLGMLNNYIESMAVAKDIGKKANEINRLFHVKENGISLTSLISSSKGSIPDFEQYLSWEMKLWTRTTENTNDPFLGKLVGNAANAALLVNPRSATKQMASLMLAWNEMNEVSLGRKIAITIPSVFKSFIPAMRAVFKPEIMSEAMKNPIFRARVTEDMSFDDISNSSVGKIAKYAGKVGGALMKMTDTWTCYATYYMADAYSKISGESADDVFTSMILETQSHSGDIYKSRIRGGDLGFGKKMIFGMFQSDSQNKVSLFMKSLADYHGANTDALKKKAKRGLVAYGAGIIASGMFALIADRLFDLFYGKRKKEELIVKNDGWLSITQDAIGIANDTLLSFIPYLNTIADWLSYGEVSYLPIDNLNTFLENSKSFLEDPTSRKSYMNMAMSVATLMGIPANTMKNVLGGFLNLAGPGAKAKYDSFFYGASSSNLGKTINEAVKAGDSRKAVEVNNFYYELYKAPISKSTSSELIRLKTAGLDASLASIPTKMDGEDITTEQKMAYAQVYRPVGKALDSLVSSTSYRRLADEEKSKAIRRLSNAYSEAAKAKASNTAPTGKLAKLVYCGVNVIGIIGLMSAIGTGLKPSEAIRAINKLTGTTKATKLIIAWLLGYSVKNANSLISALMSAGMTKNEAQAAVAG